VILDPVRQIVVGGRRCFTGLGFWDVRSSKGGIFLQFGEWGDQRPEDQRPEDQRPETRDQRPEVGGFGGSEVGKKGGPHSLLGGGMVALLR